MNVGRPRTASRLLLPGLGACVLALSVLALGAALPAATTPMAVAGGFASPATTLPSSPRTGSTAVPGSLEPPSAAPSDASAGAEPTRAGPQSGDPTPEATPSAATTALVPCHPAPAGIAPARVVSHGSRAKKVVALTFDDGWGATTTERILAILERSRVNATFFPTGQAIEQLRATWRQVARADFPIGDHTYDHRHLVGSCFVAQLDELTNQTQIVSSLLGVTPLPVMRPPYGAFDPTTRLAATGDGQRDVVLWDVDTRDWSGASPAVIASRALAGENGSIVVMHTAVPNTVLALPRIIAGYRARGFRFVTIGQLLGIPGSVPFP